MVRNKNFFKFPQRIDIQRRGKNIDREKIILFLTVYINNMSLDCAYPKQYCKTSGVCEFLWF